MIATTEALVLRVSPFSKTSHVVTWLTPTQGLLATTVRGAQRSRSAFLGQYDLYYTCELTHYLREHNGLHIAKECTPLNMRHRFRSDWRAAAAASYVSDLLIRVSMSGDHEELFRFASNILDRFCEYGAERVLLYWFELRLMQILGLAPQLQSCVVCRKDIGLNDKPLFLPIQGGIVCRSCHARDAARAVPIAPDILALLRTWQRTDSPRAVRNTRCTSEQLVALGALLGVFLTLHIDVSGQSRRIAIEMMSPQNTKP